MGSRGILPRLGKLILVNSKLIFLPCLVQKCVCGGGGQVTHSLISCCSDLSLSSVLPSSVITALLSSVIISLEEISHTLILNSVTSY